MANHEAGNTDLSRAEILWKAADALRGQIEAAEHKHAVLGLLFLKYISDSLEWEPDHLAVAHMKLAIRGIDATFDSRSHLTPDSQTLSADAKKSEFPRWR